MKKFISLLAFLLALSLVLVSCIGKDLVFPDKNGDKTDDSGKIEGGENTEDENEEIIYSEGLSFESYGNGTCYVKGIGKCKSENNIVIPPTSPSGDSVISIDVSAFENCTSLESIAIPDGVTHIGTWAFLHCTSLESITIPNSVTTIGSRAFENCTSLESITISNRVTTIGYGAFIGCTSLASVTIPNSITAIGQRMFENCTSLTSITIPNSVTEISSWAFEGCTSLSNITVDKNNEVYKSIDGNLYTNDNVLIRYAIGKTNANFVIPMGVTTVSNHAFSGCSNLRSITIPDSVTLIKEAAFENCTSLTSITIPDSVTLIEEAAFKGCDSLENIVLPFVGRSLDDVRRRSEKSVFGYIFGISDSYYDTGVTEQIYTLWNSAYQNVKKEKYFIPASLKSVTVTGSEYIPFGAFSNCVNLTSITLTDNVTYIDEAAFYGCSGLREITIPFVGKSLDAENDSARIRHLFSYRDGYYDSGLPSKLEKVTVLGGRICDFALGGIANVELANGVTAIEDGAFGDGSYGYSNSALTKIKISATVISIGDYAFKGCTGLSSVIFEDNSQLETIGNRAFYECRSLLSIDIPESVTTIGEEAFCACTSLLSVNFGNNSQLTTIGAGAFYYCLSILIIDIPASVTTIGDGAFSYDSALLRINVDDENTNYTDINGVLYSKDGKTLLCYPSGKIAISFTIPDGVTTIRDAAFMVCDSLINIEMPDSVTEIGAYAFHSCYNLKNVKMSNNVIIISSDAFGHCASLTSIVIPVSVSTIEYRAFFNYNDVLTDVYYTGSEDDWTKINIYDNNYHLNNATIHYNYVPEN